MFKLNKCLYTNRWGCLWKKRTFSICQLFALSQRQWSGAWEGWEERWGSGCAHTPAHAETWPSTATGRGGPHGTDPGREAGRCPQAGAAQHFVPGPEPPGGDGILAGPGECAGKSPGISSILTLNCWALVIWVRVHKRFASHSMWVLRPERVIWYWITTSIVNAISAPQKYLWVLVAYTHRRPFSGAPLLQRIGLSQAVDTRPRWLGPPPLALSQWLADVGFKNPAHLLPGGMGFTG